MATTPYRSTVEGGRDGFGRLLLAEWTKLRSVRRWALTLLAAVVLTVFVALLVAAGAGSESSGGGSAAGTARAAGPQIRDEGHLVFRPLTGDGSLVARVVAQKRSSGWAKAGLTIRASTRPGAAYAAVMVTPDHGVRLQSAFSTDVAGSSGGAPRWLKLTRAGQVVTGWESADGAAWKRVGAVELEGLGATADAGLFVASPDAVEVTRQFGSEGVAVRPTDGSATFDAVSLRAAQPGAGTTGAGWRDRSRSPGPHGSTWAGSTVTVTGSGDVGPYDYADDVTGNVLAGVLAGLTAIVALAVLFITSEYQQGTIRTTFAASPRRGRVLGAKAVVLAAVVLVAGLIASFAAFALSRPLLGDSRGASPSLADGPVLRAVLGTAMLLGVVAVLSLAVAALLRRTAAAIVVVLLLLLVPQILATGLPLSAAKWLERVSPAAGFAIQQTVPRYDTAIAPWAGFAVLCCYAALAFAVAAWRIGRRDA